MTQFQGKNVLITGGATGIGKEIGKIVIGKGIKNLVIWDYDVNKLKETVAEFQTRFPNVYPIVADVSDLQQLLSSAKKTREITGSVDILINNAGILIGKYFHEHTHADIHNEMAINANGYIHLTREFLPDMLTRGSGHICNIASAAGMLGNPKMSIYCASKAAVIGWSDSLRIELKKLNKEVRITLVTPNYINTEMIGGLKSLVPIVKKQDAARKIVRGIERNQRFVRMQFMVYALPLLKGILPVRWFDLIVGKGLGVYNTMNDFDGKNSFYEVIKEDRKRVEVES
jgi:all-trans-retinol dehydrogenase (NAD+)